MMNSYEVVMKILQGKKEVDRIPCVNFSSVATIDFMRATDSLWPAAHRDPVKMAKLSSAAHRLCGLDNVTVPFSTVVEAEVLGAVINYHEDEISWPSIREFLVKEPSDLRFPEDVAKAGTIPVITEAIKMLKADFGGKVPVNAYLVPPFTSLSSYLVDTISFLKCLIKEPGKIHSLCNAVLDVYIEIAELYQEAGADLITLHEMGASNDNISPDHFDEFVKPYLKKIIGRLRVPTVLNICGSALRIADKMVQCGASAIAVDERTPIAEARKAVERVRAGFPIIGNIPAYWVVHLGPVEKIRAAVKRVIDEGVDMVSPGCDFWLETPTEHISALVEATKEFGCPPPWLGKKISKS
ncbi:MAG: uroporphyrinogen decarboxylase family protein [Candidatus Hadarchaeum sp.]|uniref:uroporphyrinogen decarboxylase family protein n=1 Tax=Candidatus Hadarchaeum sp. TaxID=2883567 RepID=UPI003D0ECCE2